MLVASVAVAGVMTHRIAKPMERLGRNTRALAKGSYETRMPVTGFGEFAQLATAFNELAGTLEAKREARREWIADIAHELRTPLAVLKGEVAALQDGIREVSQERLASLRQEIDRLSQLVEDLHAQSLADFAGLKAHVDTYTLTPRLPAHWKRLAFTIYLHGKRHAIDIRPDQTTEAR